MRRLTKALVVGTGISGVALGTYKFARSPDGSFDIYNVGAARFGRAAITVRSNFKVFFESRNLWYRYNLL